MKHRGVFNPLSINPTNHSNNSSATNCLGMFDHFVGLGLKRVKTLSNIYDVAFFEKRSTSKCRQLISQKSSIIDV